MAAYAKSPSSSPSPSSSQSQTASSISASPCSPPIPLHSPNMPKAEREPRQSGATSSRDDHLLQPPVIMRGGCWTCRVRRKKCDEQRENDACYTCRRLNLNCLGWGPRRPDWMRDKKSVDAYKAEIKAQLSRAGLIRGQPRATTNPQPPRTPPTTKSPPTFVQPMPPASHYVPESSQGGSFSHSSLHQYERHQSQNLASGVYDMRLPDFSAPSELAMYRGSAASFSEPNLNSVDFDMSAFQFTPSPSLPYTPQPSGYDYFPAHFSVPPTAQAFFEQGAAHTPTPIPESVFGGHPSVHVQYLADFFSPRSYQGERISILSPYVLDVLQPLVQQFPESMVSYSVCALASYLRWCRTGDVSDESASQQFGDRAIRTLRSVRTPTEVDALGIVMHIVYLAHFAGMSWKEPMDILRAWFAGTGVPAASSPGLALSAMSTTAQCAFRLLYYLDVASSLTSRSAPTFLSTYRRLSNERYSVQPGNQDSRQRFIPHIDLICGMSDDTMIALADIAALKCWKMGESRKGSLSVRELVHRGDQIETTFRANHHLVPAPWTLPSDIASPHHSYTVSEIFAEFVNLNLAITLSDASPGVPEVSASVSRLRGLLEQASELELQTVALPAFTAGCLVRDPEQRQFFKACVRGRQITSSSFAKREAASLMEAVWEQIKLGTSPLDSPGVLNTRFANLLLL